MSNTFITFLEDVGHDFKVGLQKLDPILKKGIQIAIAEEDTISAIDPAIGAIFRTTVGVVASIEQKFAAMGQQTGTGVKKLAESFTILEPVIAQAFAAAGKASDGATVSNYISKVADFLNAIPASNHAGSGIAPAAA